MPILQWYSFKNVRSTLLGSRLSGFQSLVKPEILLILTGKIAFKICIHGNLNALYASVPDKS